MRRITALAAAVAIAGSSAAVARPMQQHGYYVIRWDNTGSCQICNTELQEKPVHFMSDYNVVSMPVPTFAAANAILEKMRFSHQCTL